jgi:Cft2 family RNA processing exonuclease
MSKVEPIYFNAPVKISTNLSITASSSGMTLGGTNWIVNYGSTKLVYVADWAKEGHGYARLIDLNSVANPDLLITTQPSIPKKILYNRKFSDMFPKIDQTLKAKSTVLFPTATIDDLFEILESLHHLLDSTGLQRPIHLLSQTGKHAILNASIFSEW